MILSKHLRRRRLKTDNDKKKPVAVMKTMTYIPSHSKKKYDDGVSFLTFGG